VVVRSYRCCLHGCLQAFQGSLPTVYVLSDIFLTAIIVAIVVGLGCGRFTTGQPGSNLEASPLCSSLDVDRGAYLLAGGSAAIDIVSQQVAQVSC
jgi:hypothetical protein